MKKITFVLLLFISIAIGISFVSKDEKEITNDNFDSNDIQQLSSFILNEDSAYLIYFDTSDQTYYLAEFNNQLSEVYVLGDEVVNFDDYVNDELVLKYPNKKIVVNDKEQKEIEYENKDLKETGLLEVVYKTDDIGTILQINSKKYPMSVIDVRVNENPFVNFMPIDLIDLRVENKDKN